MAPEVEKISPRGPTTAPKLVLSCELNEKCSKINYFATFPIVVTWYLSNIRASFVKIGNNNDPNSLKIVIVCKIVKMEICYLVGTRC